MVLCNLIGSRRYHDVTDAAEKTACKCLTASIKAFSFIRLFIKVLIEMNVNISEQLIFSDVYRSVNYTGVHLLCMRPNEVYHVNKIIKMKFFS